MSSHLNIFTYILKPTYVTDKRFCEIKKISSKKVRNELVLLHSDYTHSAFYCLIKFKILIFFSYNLTFSLKHNCLFYFFHINICISCNFLNAAAPISLAVSNFIKLQLIDEANIFFFVVFSTFVKILQKPFERTPTIKKTVKRQGRTWSNLNKEKTFRLSGQVIW